MALRPNRVNTFSYQSCVFAGDNKVAFQRLDLLRNMYAGNGAIDDKSGMPNGYNTGGIVLPLKAGGMASFNPAILNLVKSSADAKMGRALVASSTMAITNTNAQADQIVPMSADAVLAISNSDANMSAGVDAVADSTMTMTPDASLGGIIPATATSACVLTPDVDMTAKAFMVAEAGGPTELSPEGLAASVWEAILVDYADTGNAAETVRKAKTAAENAFAVSS